MHARMQIENPLDGNLNISGWTGSLLGNGCIVMVVSGELDGTM